MPFPPWALFFCLVPLWISWLRARSWWQIFWTGWLAQFVSALIGYNWIAYTVREFANFSWPTAVLLLFLFCACANLFIPVTGLVWYALAQRLRLSATAGVWLIPVLMALAERVAPMVFDWNFGYPWLWARLPAFQLADIIGFQGLSTLTLLFNGLVLWTWWLWRRQRHWGAAGGSIAALFAAVNLLGMWHGNHTVKSDAVKRFLVVQSNISDRDKTRAAVNVPSRDVINNRLNDLTREGLAASGPVDFVVWPETAFPEVIESSTLEGAYSRELRNFVLSIRTPLITGAFSHLHSSSKVMNSLFVIGADGKLLSEPYSKSVLLAFGEYTPMETWFPGLHRLIPQMGHDMGHGPGPAVLDAGNIRLGPQICYEGLLDWYSRRSANQGAQILLNATNDSWFGDWEEPFQSEVETLARAIEVRRPLIRVTNTGISAVMLADGQLMAVSPLSQAWTHLYEVPYATKPETTLFMGWGYYLIPAALLAALLMIVMGGGAKHSDA